MPVYAGYAEVINSGKSPENEDMAAARIVTVTQRGYEAETAMEFLVRSRRKAKTARERSTSELRQNRDNQVLRRRKSDDDLLSFNRSLSSDDGPDIPKIQVAYFAIFDGHAGSGAAIMSANCLHEHIKNRLCDVLESVLQLHRQETQASLKGHSRRNAHDDAHRSVITSDSLIVGALETAFVEMDNQIADEKNFVRLAGGCAAVAAVFCLGKIYVANAGDCRALLVTRRRCVPLSTDFTPVTERKRLQEIAFKQNNLIGNSFSRLEYSRYLTKKDLNRKARLLNTIGVSRGFGDHHLMTAEDNIPIKPFLCAFPEVQVLDLRSLDELTDEEVLVMASDGLWDALSNDAVASIVRSSLAQCDVDDNTKYSLVAQELVCAARGQPVDGCKWKLADGGSASMDDITVFVIPIKYASNLLREEDEDDEELLRE
ncbi:Protein C42C1.2 [Aphelenchoides avenae]|nr:Protein C42C1.2 [Aphelenchus avenae]